MREIIAAVVMAIIVFVSGMSFGHRTLRASVISDCRTSSITSLAGSVYVCLPLKQLRDRAPTTPHAKERSA